MVRASNLADLYRDTGQDGQGEAVLRAAVQSAPQDARLHYALGLTLTRLKRPDEALSELRRAAELAPEHARYGYVYAVALHTAGRREDAISILKSSLARHPGDRDTLIALITFHRDVGDAVTALGYAERLARLTPNDANSSRMIEEFRNQAKKP
jgi:Flp pilus assembly protein TadD